MTSNVRIKDYRGLTALTEEQQQQLQDASAANAQALRKLHAAGNYTFVDDMPAVKLNSGYEIPLLGLGTWWVCVHSIDSSSKSLLDSKASKGGQP
jgi:hypothetical protein